MPTQIGWWMRPGGMSRRTGRSCAWTAIADVGRKVRHPDPANVNQVPNSLFRSEQCTGCHDSVISELEAGRHGGKPLNGRSGLSALPRLSRSPYPAAHFQSGRIRPNPVRPRPVRQLP